MTLADQLSRFEALLGARFPSLLAGLEPGLDDAGIERMRAALAPQRPTPELETLYRWRNGGAAGVFAGFRLLPLEEVLRTRPAQLDQLGEPPAWFRLFGDRVIAFVTLGSGVPLDSGIGAADPSLWYGHTHDIPLDRIADSLEAFVASCADAVLDGSLIEQRGALLLDGGFSGSERPFTAHRLARSPSASDFGPASGCNRVLRVPGLDWPASWLASLGLDPARIAPRGRTHSIMDLDGEPEGTVATLLGTVRVLGAVGHTLNVVFADDSYELRLDIDTGVTVIAPESAGGLNEIDVRLGSAPHAASGVEVLAVRPLRQATPAGVGEDGA